jgi:protein-S-isoprenylcysteine O-methyltransferase Ste14
MPGLALALWGLYFLLSLGLRVLLHRRRTGRSGFLLARPGRRPLQAIGETGEAVAIALGVAAAALADAVEPFAALDGSGGHVVGIALYAAGLGGVVISQEAMGRSWRIGQDPGERTELVTSGPFGVVRNPIFASLIAVQAGLALLVPNALALAGVVLLVISIELQVRLVEEPHLRRVHGEEYERYARSVGRFLPSLR